MSLKNNSLIIALLLISGCKQMPQVAVPTLPGLGAHKIDIQQGNVITQDMLDKLQPGMTRNQVRFVLGTPLLVDPFRTDRWDYVYSLKKRGELVEQRQLKVFFQDDKMVRYEGDVVTDSKPGAPIVAGVKPAATPAAKPAVKPVAVVESKPETTASAPAPQPGKPAPEPVVVGNPQLQLAPGPGEPAKPEEIKAAAPAAASAPATPDGAGLVAPPLDAPPMPRLTIKPEQPEAAPQSGPFAETPVASKPVATPATPKPAEKPADQPGMFGRLFGRTPAQPAEPARPAVAPAPAPVAKVAPVAPAPVASPPAERPIEKPVQKPVVAAPAQKSVDKPETAQRGFFGRLLDAAAKPAPPVRFGGDRIAEPGSPPPPFVDPDPETKKP